MHMRVFVSVLGVLLAVCAQAAEPGPHDRWQLGAPIVTYWAGPPMSDAVAQQMSDGGWNLVWCGEKDLDLVHRHGLRAQLQDPLLTPASLEDPARRAQLDALLSRVRGHPALYAYFLTDEPSAADFPTLGRLVTYLRDRDPAHLAYINLFPTYASNQQLGTKGDTTAAYQAHLRQFIDTVHPSLLSYDHYQFTTHGDSDQYFLNLQLIRQSAQAAGVPFLNIVQACTWTPSMRVPQANELRYLVYTSLAYGAQGISYFVYSAKDFTGGIANADGTPTPLYPALKLLNREFLALARELQPLRLLSVCHAGHHPPGTVPISEGSAFVLEPTILDRPYHPPEPVKGVVLSCFAAPGESAASHALVVNLDYESDAVVGVRGRGPLAVFDPAPALGSAIAGASSAGEPKPKWTRVERSPVELTLPAGGGKLIRLLP
jgi:hypothetical protein